MAYSILDDPFVLWAASSASHLKILQIVMELFIKLNLIKRTKYLDFLNLQPGVSTKLKIMLYLNGHGLIFDTIFTN